MRAYLYILTFCFLLLANKSKAQKPFNIDAYPLHVIQKTGAKQVVLLLTGDGGWNSFSKSLAAELSKAGYSIIALDTKSYFWNQKNPNQFGEDAEQILSYYMGAWNETSFSIIGYSFGADVGAFLPNNMSKGILSKLKSVVLLSPGLSTGFVTKLTNMMGLGNSDKDKYKVYPEILKSTFPTRCIFGRDEKSDFYAVLKPTERVHKVSIPGSHKYNDNINLVVKAIMPGL